MNLLRLVCWFRGGHNMMYVAVHSRGGMYLYPARFCLTCGLRQDGEYDEDFHMFVNRMEEGDGAELGRASS